MPSFLLIALRPLRLECGKKGMVYVKMEKGKKKEKGDGSIYPILSNEVAVDRKSEKIE